MTIGELYNQYCDEANRANTEYEAWSKSNPRADYSSYKGAMMTGERYGWYQEQIAQTIRENFGFSDRQVGVIMGEAYERYHSSFGDMFYGAYGIAEFVRSFLSAA